MSEFNFNPVVEDPEKLKLCLVEDFSALLVEPRRHRCWRVRTQQRRPPLSLLPI